MQEVPEVGLDQGFLKWEPWTCVVHVKKVQKEFTSVTSYKI